MRFIRLGHTEKYTVAEHELKTGHNNDFSIISIQDKATGFINCMIKVTEIKLCPRNVNRDKGFTLSQSWYPVTNILNV
jgi:hypothetical protein